MTQWRATTFRLFGCFWITAPIRLWPPTLGTRQSNWPTAPAWRPSSLVGVAPLSSTQLHWARSRQNGKLEQQLWKKSLALVSFEEGWRLVFATWARTSLITAFDAINKGWNWHWCGALPEVFFWPIQHLQEERPCHPAAIEENFSFRVPFQGLKRTLKTRRWEAALLPNSLQKQ